VLLRPLTYARPDSVADAVGLLAANPDARPLAGGQSLVNVLKLRAAQVAGLVDISRLEELRGVAVRPDGALEIGAGLRYVELARHPVIQEHVPVVATIADGLVDVQVRNRGTLGGNICFNDPTSNYPPLLVALDARIVIAGPDEREVPAGEFFLGPFRCALRAGEIVRSVVVPATRTDDRVGYASLQLARDSWALARSAVRLRLAADGTIADARVVVACIGPKPARQTAIEQALIGTDGHGDAVDAAIGGALEDVEAVGDSHASAEYRLQMARVYVRRAVDDALTTTENAA
jgi:carbon-monoxide dehydrogenase medium subunit